MIYISGILFYLFSRKKGKEKGKRKRERRKERKRRTPLFFFSPHFYGHVCFINMFLLFMSLFAYFFLALYILPTFLHLILVIG
jgi:hypothetical protein